MYRDRNKSSGSGSSTKGDEVEIVSKFLAPLCDRDETARNIALAAAQTTVEGWLGGVAEPNHCQEEIERMKNSRDEQIVKFKGQNGRYDMSIERTPTNVDEKYQSDNQRYQINQVKNIHDNFGTESFFPQSVTEHLAFPCDSSSNLDCIDKYHLESFDCVDGRTSNSNTLPSSTNKDRRHIMDRVVDNVAPSNTTSFDEAKGLKIENRGKRFNRDNDTRFSSSGDSERKLLYYSSNDKINELQQTTSDDTKHRFFRNKGARQKQLDDDDLDSDTRLYGKSPKFDDNMGNFGYFESNYRSYLSSSEPGRRSIDQGMSGYFFDFDETSLNDDQSTKTKTTTTTNNPDGVVFNTLDGFENDYMIASYDEVLETINLECTNPSNDKIIEPSRCYESSFQDHYLRNNDDRKFTAGQTKRPLSQDEDVSSKNGRLLKGPEVTPGDVGRMLNLGNALDGPRQQTQPNKYLSLVTMHLPVILRLSVNCPFQNVRIKCSEILQLVKDRGLPVPVPTFDGPSTFVPTSELPDVNSLDERTHMLLMDAFLQNNRLDHVSRVMSSHPSYLEHFLRTQHFILRGDGPLPYDYRHLIAIMAAGRHQCSYLINLQKSEFILQSGDPTWLQGLRSIPNKLQNLYEINKILAHRPWLLNKTHIEKLTKGADNWSLAEVVHAIVLLAHFHSLSSFVFSCGINEELDNVTGHHYKENVPDNSNNLQPAKDKLSSSPKKIPTGCDNIPSPPSSPSIVGEQEVGVETLLERMKRLSEKSESYEITQEELSKRFESVETQSAELAAAPQRNSKVLDSDIGLFIEDPTFIYQDFAKRGQLNDIPTFRVQDYSWDDHGYSLVNRLYNDVGNLLDDKFKIAYNLTYYTMGAHDKVDTSRFRRAIWNYIQCMFGIRHDDYDYNEVNQLLERSLKTFIKSAVCYPERVTKRDYDRVMREFKHSEKVHVNLMILEARMQAELLYALRAVMRYMT